MSGADITVLVLSVLAIAGLGWYFFAPARVASPIWAMAYKIAVTVKGGYRTISVHARASRWRSNSTGRSPANAPTGWCSLTLASAPVSAHTRPQCGYAPTGPARSVLPAA